MSQITPVPGASQADFNALADQIANFVKTDTFDGTTNANGNVSLGVNRIILRAVGRSATYEYIYIPAYSPLNGAYLRVIGWDGSAKGNTAVQVTYQYLSL